MNVERYGLSPAMALTFAEAYDEHVWQVYGFFSYRLASRTEAEDLTQRTFERALRAWSRYDPDRASISTWLLVIARNLLIDHFRATAARPEAVGLDVVAESELPHAADVEADLGLAPGLADALKRLGDREREILALRFGGDLTGPEIAEATGLTLANVQQILSRSLRRLRALLDERGFERS